MVMVRVSVKFRFRVRVRGCMGVRAEHLANYFCSSMIRKGEEPGEGEISFLTPASPILSSVRASNSSTPVATSQLSR